MKLHASLTLAPDEGEWSASRTGRFTTGKRDPQYPLDRRLGGPCSLSRGGGEEKSVPSLPLQPVA
jgi:hypothetical protein